MAHVERTAAPDADNHAPRQALENWPERAGIAPRDNAMHLLHMSFDNARVGGPRELGISRNGDEIAKWTILDEGAVPLLPVPGLEEVLAPSRRVAQVFHR